MMRLRLALVVATLLVPAAAADASTVDVGPSSSARPELHWRAVRYLAARGERNRVLVSFAQDDPQGTHATVTIHDPGAVIDAGSGCASVDAHTASCVMDTSTLGDTEARLRDRGDTLRTLHPLRGVDAYGGSGDDLLDGGDGIDRLYGGSGHDRLLGGARSDLLVDGDGSHAVASRGRDVIDGGPALDTVSYSGRKRPVTVDLRHDVGGERGERDALRRVERAIGGAGGDRLVGDGRGNRFHGLGGRDVLIGRGGPDLLDGGRGRDRLTGGGDGDTLRPGPALDRVSCSSGADFVYQPIAGELLGSCENARFEVGDADAPIVAILVTRPTSIDAQSAVFQIPCPEYYDEEGTFHPCGGRISVTGPSGNLLASGTIPQRSDRSEQTATAQLTERGRRLTARPDGVVATIRLSDGFAPEPVAWTIRVRR
jgi:hypothetical protein